MFFDFAFPKKKDSLPSIRSIPWSIDSYNSYDSYDSYDSYNSNFSYKSKSNASKNIEINYIFTKVLPKINSNQSQDFKNEMIFMAYNFNVYTKMDTLIDELTN